MLTDPGFVNKGEFEKLAATLGELERRFTALYSSLDFRILSKKAFSEVISVVDCRDHLFFVFFLCFRQQYVRALF
jgi:23S rRNA A2030 N6-methylase RlmJ